MNKIILTIIFILLPLSPLLAQEVEEIETPDEIARDTTEEETSEEDSGQVEDLAEDAVLKDEVESEISEDDNSIKSSNKYFDLELVIGGQRAISKKIPLTLYVTPHIDSPETQIMWSIPSVFKYSYTSNSFVSLRKDVTYTYSLLIDPQRAGSYTLSANVISWQYDTNKTNSVSQTIKLGESLVIQPTPTSYTLGLLGIVLGGGLAFVGLIFGIFKGVKLLAKNAKKWFTPPV
jgi:hypothetical protein